MFFSFYEGLGVFVKKGYLDIELIALMWAGMTRRFYENIVEPIIEGAIRARVMETAGKYRDF